MEKHVTAVGVLNIGYGLLGVLIGVVLFGTLAGTGLLVDNDPTGRGFLIACGTGAGLLMALLSAPDIVGGIGVLMRKRWARILQMISAVVSLFVVPVGTVVGAYTLWVLLQDETEQLFDQEAVEPIAELDES